MMPLDDLPGMPPGSPPISAAVKERQAVIGKKLDDCEAFIADLIGKMQAMVADCLNRARQTKEECAACINGGMWKILDAAAEVAGKCADKLLDAREQIIHKVRLRAAQCADDLAAEPMPLPSPITEPTEPPGGQPGPILPGPPMTRPGDPGHLPPAEPGCPPCEPAMPGEPVEPMPPGSPGEPGPPTMPPREPTCPAPPIIVMPPACPTPPGWTPPPAPPPTPPGGGVPPYTPGLPRPPIEPPGEPGEPPAGPGPIKPPGAKPGPSPSPPEPTQPTPGLKGLPQWPNPSDSPNWPFYTPGSAGHASKKLAVNFGLETEGGAKLNPDWLAAMKRGLPEVIRNGLESLIRGGLKAFDDWSRENVLLPDACSISDFAALAVQNSLIGLLERWLGLEVDQLKQSVQQWSNARCPVSVPGIPDALQLVLTDTLSQAGGQGIAAANGLGAKWFDQLLIANRAKLSAQDAVRVFWRGLWSEENLHVYLRQLGFTDLTERSLVEPLMRYIPGPADLIRFMMRDVADLAVVDHFKLDDEFEKKFHGKLKDAAKFQGVPEEVMRWEWRAHWSWPSNTQLYEMLQRLRPDHIDPKLAKIAVTDDDVRTVLGINDIAPVWRERLVAIAYHKLTRIDARNAFLADVLNDVEAKSAIRDMGYDERNAELLLDLWRKQKEKKLAKEFDPYPLKQVIADFVAGLISRGEAWALAEKSGYPTDKITELLEKALLKRKVKNRKAHVAAIRTRYEAGEFDLGDAISLLVSVGIDADQAVEIAGDWRQRIKLRGKEASAAQLCKWFGTGLISEEEYIKRLIAVGWIRKDAERFAANCVQDLMAKMAKEEEKRRKAQEKEAKKYERNGKSN